MNKAQKGTFLVLVYLYNKTIRMKAEVSVSRQGCCMRAPENAWEQQERPEKRGRRELAAAAGIQHSLVRTRTGIGCMLASLIIKVKTDYFQVE